MKATRPSGCPRDRASIISSATSTRFTRTITGRPSSSATSTRMDADIGRLFALLKKLGLDERTLVIFSSDNGPSREAGQDPEFFNPGGPLRGFKRSLTEGGIREPTLARWPGRIKPGSVT